jgi:hypothetical protein
MYYYSKHSNGFILDTLYGQPCGLSTPWGYWDFARGVGWGEKGWPAIIPELAKRFDWKVVKTTKPFYEHNQDYSAVVSYGIHKIDGVDLPTSKHLRRFYHDRYRYCKRHKEARVTWELLENERNLSQTLKGVLEEIMVRPPTAQERRIVESHAQPIMLPFPYEE